MPSLPDGSAAKLPLGAIRSALLHDLYARYYQDIDTYQDNDVAAAFQLAVWEITHENMSAGDLVGAQMQLDLTQGAFQSDDAGVATNPYIYAQLMMFSLGYDGWHTFDGLSGLTNLWSQDQLIVVPLPMTAALGALGLACGAMLRRRLR